MVAGCKCSDYTVREGCGGGVFGYQGDSRIPPQGETLAPWVCIQFENLIGGRQRGKPNLITVGNDSAPNADNAAVVKSFEFGQEDGFEVRVVIHDQQGGAFEVFMDHLLSDWDTLEGNPVASRMRFQFGWARAGCEAPYGPLASPCFYAIVDSIETSFMEGKFIAEISAVDLGHRMPEGGTETVYGGPGKEGICLREAIEKLMMEEPRPQVKSVDIVKFEGGMSVPCGFEDYDEDCGCKNCIIGYDTSKTPPSPIYGDNPQLGGKKGNWHSQGADKLHVLCTWLSVWRAEGGKSWRIAFDPMDKEGKLIISRAEEPKCKPLSDAEWRETCIGTYVVNGGKDSSVIEFNPKIRWDFSRFESVGGASSNNTTLPLKDAKGDYTDKSKGVEIVDCPTLIRSRQEGAGQAQNTVETQQRKDVDGKEAADKADTAESSFRKANEHSLMHDEIGADLVIVGDPSFINPYLMREKNIGIIFINPFYISKSSDDRCGEWLAAPPMNKVLTNGAWRIRSVSHRVELGTYTTTLQVYLVKGDVGMPLGLWAPGYKK